MRVEQVSPEDMIELHEMYSGIRLKDVVAFSRYDGESCHIWTVKTDTWNDNRALAALGHEMYHCLGANHE
jgi:hypothetical protein